MKKEILTIIALVAGLTIQAEVLKEEAFLYEIGTPIEQTENWSTPWKGTSGITVTNGLDFTGYASGEKEGALELNSDCGSYQPHMDFGQVAEGSVYTAFLLYPYANYKPGWLLSYRQEPATNTTTFSYVGRVSLNDENQIGLRYFKNAPAVYDTKSLSPTTVYLCVLKYEIKPGDHNDEVSLYVFDELPDKEPSQATIGPLTDSSSPDILPEVVVVRSYDKDSWISIGKIRVATTFAEAIGREATGIEPGARKQEPGARKYLEGGRLVIEKNGRKYSAIGLNP